MSARKRLAFVVVLVLALIAAAEGLLQILAASSRSIDALLSVEPVRSAVRDRDLVWRGNPAYPEHDRLGFRNPDVPPTAALVALGDSQTYGARVKAEAAWPRQLQHLGAGRTYNMAFPGWGPPQTLLALDEALALKPKLVVAAVYTGNDLVDSFTFVYHRKHLTRLRTADPRARQAIEAAEEADPWDDNAMADQMPTKFADPDPDEDPPGSPEELLAARSKLFGLANALRRAYDYYRRHPDRAEADDEDDPLKDDDYIPFETDRYQTVLTPSYREQAVDWEDPRVAEGLRITQEVLAEMRDRCAEQGVRFVVVFIPTKELVLREAVRANLAEVPPIYSRMVEQEDTVRGWLGEQLAARGIVTLDTLPALRAVASDGALPYSETKDGHLSARGQQTVAALVDAAIGHDLLESGPSGGEAAPLNSAQRAAND